MTPNITKTDAESRPLFNPSYGQFGVLEIVRRAHKEKGLRQARLSDLVLGAILLAIHHEVITRSQADIFETVFVQHARVRKFGASLKRLTEGHPFRAPDRSVITVDGVVFGGEAKLPAGPWTIEDVSQAEGFGRWSDVLFFTRRRKYRLPICVTDPDLLPVKNLPGGRMRIPKGRDLSFVEEMGDTTDPRTEESDAVTDNTEDEDEVVVKEEGVADDEGEVVIKEEDVTDEEELLLVQDEDVFYEAKEEVVDDAEMADIEDEVDDE